MIIDADSRPSGASHTGRGTIGTLLLVALLALGASYYYFHLLLPQARARNAEIGMAGGYAYGGDFYPIWLTTRELLRHHRDPYTRQITQEIQIGLFGRTMDWRRKTDPPANFRAFVYPLYTDLLAAPLALLGFDRVRVGLGLLLPFLTAGGFVLWLEAFDLPVRRGTLAIIIVLSLVSYPILEGLYALQVGLFVGAILAAAVAALARGQNLFAGMLLAFACVKPQLVWLLAIWLLLWAFSVWKRRRVFALSFIFTLTTLLLLSQIVLPGWVVAWWRAITQYPSYTLPPLTQLVLGRFLGNAVGLAMLALAGAICWIARRREPASAEFSLAVSFVLAVTIILSPTGGAVYDQVILIPAIFWLGARRAALLGGGFPIRVEWFAAVIVMSWQWFAASAVALLSVFFPVWARRPAVLVFPTRMAAPLPFAILALLSFFAVKLMRGEAMVESPLSERS
ncbi:MAG TPA: glycosyltransferase 87 family protein [Candidatus Sulfotelmatobacter sp.]|jgi:hypothetical protein